MYEAMKIKTRFVWLINLYFKNLNVYISKIIPIIILYTVTNQCISKKKSYNLTICCYYFWL